MRTTLARLLPRRRPPSPWQELLSQGVPERLADAAGTRVLCATSVGGHPVAPLLDSLVGMALWLRGAEVTFLLCDSALPACEHCSYVAFPAPQEFVEHGPQRRLCTPCFAAGSSLLGPLPPPLRRYSEFVRAADAREALADSATLDLAECLTFERNGLRLGEQTRAALLRFFGKADLTTEPPALVLEAARRYAAGAVVAARVAERVLAASRADVLVAHHGVYVPQGVLGTVARRDSVRVVNWGPSYRDRTFIYSHRDTYHLTMIDEPVTAWDRRLTHEQETELLEFLARRRRGEGDWAWVTPEAALKREEQQEADLRSALALDPGLPTFGLLTNVLWDAQLYYGGHAFEHMLDWLWFTIEHFARHADRQLLVRIHPHEVKQGNRQPVEPELRRRYPTLPTNVRVVSHESPLNTYALMQLCRAVLIYGTKTGVELTPLGIPVVVAGDAWIRGKGLTSDVSAREQYERVLDDLPAIRPLGDDTIDRARRYSYHYFFRRMIPVSSFVPDSPTLRLGIDRLSDLLPGNDPGLDTICRGILEQEPFVHDPA